MDIFAVKNADIGIRAVVHSLVHVEANPISPARLISPAAWGYGGLGGSCRPMDIFTVKNADIGIRAIVHSLVHVEANPISPAPLDLADCMGFRQFHGVTPVPGDRAGRWIFSP